MKPFPLRTALTLTYTGLLAVLLTVTAVAYHSVMRRQLDADTTERLAVKARGLEGYLQFPNGTPALVFDRNDPGEAAFIDDVTDYYQIYNAVDGRLLVQSPGLKALGLLLTPAEVEAFHANQIVQDIETDNGRLRLFTALVSPRANESYLLQVGELLRGSDQVLSRLDRLLFWQIVIGLALAGVIGRWLAGHGLGPLSRLADAAESIGITSLHQRLAVRGTRDEIDRVAQAFNATLARVEGSVGEMRQFSAALAHELRTPLAILRGEAELALRRESSLELLRQTLANQVDEFDRLTRLINQILTLARAEAGEFAMADSPVDLTTLARSLTEQLEEVAAASNVLLTCDAQAAAFVAGDAGWLERLLLILLDNAITFTPEGGRVTIDVSQSGDRVQTAVRDTGIGIAAEALPHLFERFYRRDTSRTRRTSGAGLGLALAKWIAERHHATITVESQPGAGSTFVVTFPALMPDRVPCEPRGPDSGDRADTPAT